MQFVLSGLAFVVTVIAVIIGCVAMGAFVALTSALIGFSP